MTYYQFIHAVEGKVKEEVKGNVSVRIHSAVKNNGTKRHGLTIAEKGRNIFPTIYLEEYYQQFQNGSTVEKIAGEILRLYREVRLEHSFEGEYLNEYQKLKDKIVCRLVNREANQEMLEDVPYEEYLDLAVIFYVLLEINSYGMASMMITNEQLEQWGVTKKEISELAQRNTRRLLPYEFRTMYSLMEDLLEANGIKEPEWSTFPEDEDILYVLSNRLHTCGAAAILYENLLEGIGAYLKGNYYVLPSSVHEVLIVPEGAAPGRADLDRLVWEVNETQVEADEILSDHAYYYDREKGKLLF